MWNYRLVEVGNEVGLYEVYYDDEGEPCNRTFTPVGIVAYKDEDLQQLGKMVALAFEKPVLTDEDFIGKKVF